MRQKSEKRKTGRDSRKAVLTEGPIGKTLFRLTVPMTMGILAMVAFNLTDTFFVSRLGTKHLAALSFTFPVILVLTRFALGIGVGAASVVSRAIGMGDWKSVRRLTTDGLGLSLFFVAIFVVAGLFSIDKLFGALGAEGEILDLVREYMRIWYFGLIFVVVPMVSNNGIRATGDTKTPAMIMLVAVVVNTALDPLLIFGIGPFPEMGLAGAALATLIARMVTFAVSFYVIYKKLKMVTFERPGFDEMIDSWKRILYIALPAAVTRIIVPVGQGVITGITAAYGTNAVAALGVAIRTEYFAFAVVMALSSVLAPFVGQNWGAGKFDRVKAGIKKSNRFAMVWGFGSLAVLALVARPVAGIFSSDPDVISNIVLYMRIVPLAYFLQMVLMLVTGTLNVLNKPFHAAAIGVGQVILLTIPLAFIGSAIFGLKGVFMGIAIAYLISGIFAQVVLWRQVRKVEEDAIADAAVS
ncbi:MAG: MATE family efflux transporter [Bacteroidales bacterium]|nr:MATE family efflux transporter [Candidatus Latescibacterota bacterium]